jgi:2-C-methyl-D-erythritol 2,4-cyclodiphosphate synthase
MAKVMGIDVSQVSVKATTTEKLGFVGRGEGCEVYAVALLVK